MVRGGRYLEIIAEEGLVENAARRGEVLLVGLRQLGKEFEGKVRNARGKGLMCAIDLDSPDLRKKVMDRCHENGLMMLSSGSQGIRFRPALNVTQEEIEEGLSILRRSVAEAIG